ncbi:MAG: hypothetical protein J6S67_21165 [Methanobrevibacter sp.]|nr:hypothetical protein [Methanobrevibacter sp.]
MKNYEQNMADKDLVVHSIKVLTEIKGGGITEIKRGVEQISQKSELYQKQQEKYWSSLSDDGIIKAFEKVYIKREMENIRQSYAALYAQAEAAELVNTPYFADYRRTYEALRTYIYETLKLFDDMSAETVIEDRDAFNAYFASYYYSEKFTSFAMAEGLINVLDLRVLESLSESGTNDEIAIYKGNIYQYEDGTWLAVGLEGYMGVMTSFPQASLNQYFLSGGDFSEPDILYVNDEQLIINDTPLYIDVAVDSGFIYVKQENSWKKITDKDDWRYVVAMVDLVRITGELPGVYQTAIDTAVDAAKDELNEAIASVSGRLAQEISDRAGQYTIINGAIVEINNDITDLVDSTTSSLTAQAQALQEEIAARQAQGEDVTELQEALELINSQLSAIDTELDTKVDHLPEYLGRSSTTPSNPGAGDFFVYSGASSGSWYKSDVYRYDPDNTYSGEYGSGHWQRLDSTDFAYHSYYMMALEDILALNNASDGYFASLFASAFWTNSATMEKLSTKTIYLRQGGYMMSDNLLYEEGVTGLRIDAAGNLDANGNTHIAGKVAIGVPLKNSQGQLESDFDDYDVVIGGNTKIGGNVDLKDVNIGGNTIIEGDSIFKGKIQNAVMEIKYVTEGELILYKEYAAGSNIWGLRNYLIAAGLSTTSAKSVKDLFGSNFIGYYNEEEILTISYVLTTEELWWLDIVTENETYTLFSTSTVPKDFVIYTFLEAALSVIFKNLPTIKPSTQGRLWNDGGVLKIV